MRSLPSLLALLASTGALAAPWSDEAADVVASLDEASRFELAVELAQSPDTEIESVIALRGILAAEDDDDAAVRAALTDSLLALPMRPGWRELYADLATDEPDASRAFELRFRQARASFDTVELRQEAVGLLEALQVERPDRDDTAVLLGHAHLVEGRTDSARQIFGGALSMPEAREGLVLSWLADPDAHEATWWRAVVLAVGRTEAEADAAAQASDPVAGLAALLLQGVASPPARVALVPRVPATLSDALAAPSRVTRAAALSSYGYGALALQVLQEPPVGGTTVPEEVALSHMKGRLLLEAGEPDAAAEAFEQGLAVQAGQPSLRDGLVEALVASDRAVEALVVLGGSDPTMAARVTAHIDLAATRRTDDKLDDGPALRAAYHVDPENTELAEELGTWLFESAQSDAALAPMKVALDGGLWTPALARHYVEAALEVHRADAALEVARDGVGRSLPAKDQRSFEQLLAYAWVKKGELAKFAGEREKMVDAYAVAHLLQPDDAGVLRGLGGALWGADRPQRAYDVYAAAFELDPDDAGALDGLVKLAVQLEREDEVRELLSDYSSRPAVRTTLRNLDLLDEISAAEAARERGDLEAAYLRYKQIQQRDPENPTAYRGLASIALARGDEARALELFRQARAAEPDNPWSLLGEANGLISVGRFPEAESILSAVDNTPDPKVRTEVRKTRARMLMEQGVVAQRDDRDDEALLRYQESLVLASSTWTFTNLGSLYAKHGQFGEARAMYEEAWSLDPTNVYARIGHAGLYVDRGYLDTGEELLDGLPSSNANVVAARTRISVLRAQKKADDARQIGEIDDARRIVTEMYATWPDDPTAKAAWQTELLDLGAPGVRLTNARSMLAKDAHDLRALGTALDAAHALRKTADVLPLFEAAAEGGEADHLVLRDMARLTTQLERSLAMDDDDRHDDAVGLVEQIMEGASADTSTLTLIGGTWLQLREPKRAEQAFEAARELTGDDPYALIGLAGTYATQGRSGKGIDLLDEAWQSTADPVLGLALADMYQGRRQYKMADEVLEEVARSTGATRSTVPLEVVTLPSGRTISDFPEASEDVPVDPRVELKRRELKEKAPDGYKPGLSVGAGVYSRPGFSGEQFLTAFFIPVRLHELRAGPVAFDVEAVPYILSDAVDSAQGASLSAGLQAALGPVGLHLRGGVSPVGFQSAPYFTWYGAVDVGITEQVRLGFITSREAVTDSLTSWAGKADAVGNFYGRVHRTSFGGYLGVSPTEESAVSLFGRGGWNDGLRMPRVAFWEGGAQGSYRFKWDRFGLKVGASALAMSFSQQLDKFRPGEGGFFAPELFVMGGVAAEGTFRTRDDRLQLCAGARVGPQYLAVEDPSLDPDAYIQPGVFFGYSLGVAVDWKVARFWWLGIDYSRTVTGNTWQQNIAMLHLHFGPNDAWSRQASPVFSPLAGAPVVYSQTCGH